MAFLGRGSSLGPRSALVHSSLSYRCAQPWIKERCEGHEHRERLAFRFAYRKWLEYLSDGSDRDLRFGPLTRTSYASPAPDTTNLPLPHGPQARHGHMLC